MTRLSLRNALGVVSVSACALLTPLSSVYAQALDADDPRIVAFEHNVIAISEIGQENPSFHTIEERLAFHGVPGAAVAIIDDGAVVWSKGYGVLQTGDDTGVNPETLFSAGSVSKMINAALILRLVDEGILDLDADIRAYLGDWAWSETPFSQGHAVTLRQILSHTAGFNVHGFADFQPEEALPTTLQILNGEAPAKNDQITVTFTPGDHMEYSGGGIMVSQHIVEHVTGLSYEEAAHRYVFTPLGMTRSTFANPLPQVTPNVAKAHNGQGEPQALPRGWESMPELAASGLWTDSEDLSAFVLALLDPQSGFLRDTTLRDMLSRQARSWHGLGPRINGEGETYTFHHSGSNNSYKAYIEGQPNNGDGIVILTNGQEGHWIFVELRKSAELAFNWPIKAETGYNEPVFE